MARIGRKTLEDLEFSLVLEQISDYCITEPGKERVSKIKPFSNLAHIEDELRRVVEFKASFGEDNPIPNHGFDAIYKELHLLAIENSTLEISGFRKIKSIAETTQLLLKYFKKYEEFYVHLNAFSESVSYTSLISNEIRSEERRVGKECRYRWMEYDLIEN